MKRNVREVEKKSNLQNDIGDLAQDLDESNSQYAIANGYACCEDYETDEEDYHRIEEALGLDKIEQEIKEAEMKNSPDKQTPMKNQGMPGIPPKIGMKPMPRMGNTFNHRST